MSQSSIYPIAPEWDWERNGALIPGICIGNVVCLSGQLAVGPDGMLVGEGDLIAQARQCLDNVRSILQRVGASMTDVVKITTYFACDLDESVAQRYWSVRSEYFGTHRPASTGVQVKALYTSQCLIELDIIAVVQQGDKARLAAS